MSDLKVGSTIYRRNGQAVRITGETKVSWIVGNDSWCQAKIKKSAMRKGNSGEHWICFFVEEQDALDCVYADNNRHKIGKEVGDLRDGNILRQIATLIGYRESL